MRLRSWPCSAWVAHPLNQGEIFCIAMEYADGGDLEGVIKNQGRQLMLESEALYFFVQICFALKFLHDKNVIHRDLKPQNIFLMRCGGSIPFIVKVGDLGVARVSEFTTKWRSYGAVTERVTVCNYRVHRN